MNKPSIEDVIERCMRAMPQDLQEFKADWERHVRAALSSALTKMDLVSREEFDVQARLLERTWERLERMRETLDRLERDRLEPDDPDRETD